MVFNEILMYNETGSLIRNLIGDCTTTVEKGSRLEAGTVPPL